MKNKDKFIVLGTLLGGVTLFFLLCWLGGTLADAAPGIMLTVTVIVLVFYTADTSRLLYLYYGANPPIFRFCPIIGEFYLMDSKYRRRCLLSFLLSLVPLGLVLIFNALEIIVYLEFARHSLILFFFLTTITQIVLVGYGLMKSFAEVLESYYKVFQEPVKAHLFEKVFAWVPFLRIFTIHSMHTYLTVLYTINGMQSSDTNTTLIEEEY